MRSGSLLEALGNLSSWAGCSRSTEWCCKGSSRGLTTSRSAGLGQAPTPSWCPSGGGSQKHLLNTKPHDTSPLPPLWSRSGQQRSFIMGKLAPTEIKALSPAGSVTSDLARCRAGLAPHHCRLEEPHPHCASQSPVSQHRVPKTALCAGEQTCFLPPCLAFPCSSQLFLMYHLPACSVLSCLLKSVFDG